MILEYIKRGCLCGLFLILALCGRSQSLPTPEQFVKDILDSTHIYLVAGADSGWFSRYNYDEWENYTLKETVPLTTLQELSEKVSLARYPYFWKKERLPDVMLLTRHQGDSLIATGPHRQPLEHRPFLYSISLPQFTDDGQYAVIDINLICGVQCGQGFTCIYHRTAKGWKLIGKHNNWSS